MLGIYNYVVVTAVSLSVIMTMLYHNIYDYTLIIVS